MLIDVTGFNYTGAGTVFDLLKEYDETKCVEGEISLIHFPDGITDLEYNLNNSSSYFNGDVAIQRFLNFCKNMWFPREYRKEFLKLSEEYIDALCDGKWQGHSSFDGSRLTDFSFVLWKIKDFYKSVIWHFFKKVVKVNNRAMYLAFKKQNFTRITHDYLTKVVSLLNPDNKVCVLDQFFSAYNPLLGLKYLPGAKCIIVNRDPRDVFLLGRAMLNDCTCYPTQDVQTFVKYYHLSYFDNYEDNAHVLRMNFEDMIYNYDTSCKKIEQFVGVKKHVTPKKYFDPAISINNTQLKEKYPEFAEDIAYIEKELKDYLYPFPYVRRPEGKEF